MKRRLTFLFISLLIPAFCFAQEIKEPEKEKIEISPEVVEKKLPSHVFNLKQLIKEAEKNIKKVDTRMRNQEREVTVRQHFEKGNQLYQEGKLKEAKQEWQEALSITKDPEMKEYIRRAQRKSEEKVVVKDKKDEERKQRQEQVRLEKQKKEEALAKKKEEQERRKQLNLQNKEQERKQKEEQIKLEKEKREKERLAAKKKCQEELTRKEYARQRQKAIEKQLRELERKKQIKPTK